MKHVFILLALTQLTLGCGTTNLTLKDGRKVRGMVTSSDANQIQLESADDGSAISVNRSDVQEVDFSGDSAASTGMGLTISGVILIATGLSIGGAKGWNNLEGAIIGFLTVVVGAPLTLTGVPLWVAGAVTKSEQRKLYEFDAQAGVFQTPKQPGTYKLTLAF